jgi:NTP pyrophosphatase (non-canonical NTP hydrolase)
VSAVQVLEPDKTRRGEALLLEHCEVFGRFAEARRSAALRLEAHLGDELAQLLVFALAADQRRRPRSLAR